MPIIKDEVLKQNVHFVCNPAVEMLCSLHVLTDPGHHVGCRQWVDHAKSKMNKKLLDTLMDFGHKYSKWTFVMDVADVTFSHQSLENDNIKGFIDSVGHLSIEAFSYIFLGATLLPDKQKVEAWLQNPHTLTAQALGHVPSFIQFEHIQHYVKNAEKVRSDMLKMLEQYWNQFFYYEWVKLKPFYLSRLAEEKNRFEKTNVIDYLLNLHSDLAFEDGFILMKKDFNYAFRPTTISDIYLHVSVFTAPHLMLNIYENALSLYINAAMPSPTGDEADKLLPCIKAMSDFTRLNIIKTLMNGQTTTKDLAKHFSVTPATISQHLKVLKEAGLVLGSKDKNLVYYEVNKERLSAFLDHLSGFLK